VLYKDIIRLKASNLKAKITKAWPYTRAVRHSGRIAGIYVFMDAKGSSPALPGGYHGICV